MSADLWLDICPEAAWITWARLALIARRQKSLGTSCSTFFPPSFTSHAFTEAPQDFMFVQTTRHFSITLPVDPHLRPHMTRPAKPSNSA